MRDLRIPPHSKEQRFLPLMLLSVPAHTFPQEAVGMDGDFLKDNCSICTVEQFAKTVVDLPVLSWYSCHDSTATVLQVNDMGYREKKSAKGHCFTSK
ncbi:hypothetical protein CEXT_411491 [Caerostris extrusa]|uniref:Uncharacterized protein n=1 Tax=Caerostris extrusa TaxID=172846 RepID=A0AAV4QSG2_CAEEX|nr:hypothetical protein CEXT_411491 [Caerostris extrusa]